MKTHFINIKKLIQVRETEQKYFSGQEMRELPCLENAYMTIENDLILDYGLMKDFSNPENSKQIDISGKSISPTWVDSHTHLVFAGTRENEFRDRILGLSYQEIAEKGGGILNSAKKLNETPLEVLFEEALSRLHKLIKLGTGAIEIKSGYGLSHEGEIKMLEAIKKLKKVSPIPIKATYLAAHALPKEFKDNKSEYIDDVINKTLPYVAEHDLAEYIDVFCEKGYFDLEDTERVLKAGKVFGLKPKTHVNQFNAFGGVKLSTDYNAVSVDHLEELREQDISALKASHTIPVALPGCSFFLNIPYTQGRELINANLPLAIASDFNPGSSPNGNMNLIVSLACIKMKLLPEEAINAATYNAAACIELTPKLGSISKGKLANFIITNSIPSYTYMPYAFGENHINEVWINGKPF